MTDLLTHVLAAYIIGTILSFRYSWLEPRFITVLMVGAMLPDLNRLQLIVHPYLIETMLGTPFSWFGFHTLGGVVLTSLLGAMLVGSEYRRHVLGLLLLGAVSHLVLDSFLYLPSGVSQPLWWPLTEQRFSTPGLYMSYHRIPVVLAGASALLVWYANRRFKPEAAP